jgi:pimeloyl-ACP methyl ester carboxylesterase
MLLRMETAEAERRAGAARPIQLAERGLWAITEGPEEGPLALCLHGFPDIPETYAHLMAALATRGYRAVAPYLRGYHPSTIEGAVDLEALVDDLFAWVEHLAPAAPVHLVGHDWGAVITHLALLRGAGRFGASVAMSVPHPLAFLGNAARDPAQLRRSGYMAFFQAGPLADALVARRHGAFVERLWRDWSPGFEPPRDHLMKVRNCLMRSMPRPLDFYRETARAALRSRRWYVELTDPASRPETPLLYLHGERDGCVGPRVARGQERHYRGVFEQETLPGVGHFLHLERPDLVVPRIVGFLERHRPEAA